MRYGDEAETMEQAIFCTSSNSWLNRVEGQLEVGLQEIAVKYNRGSTPPDLIGLLV